jgi:hypothetical protein
VIRAARYAQVPPWELIEQPRWWFEHLLAAMEDEARGTREAQRAEEFWE